MNLRTTSEACPTCASTRPSEDPGDALGVISWRIIPSWGRWTGYPVSFECPNGHSSRAIGELQAWFGVRELSGGEL